MVDMPATSRRAFLRAASGVLLTNGLAAKCFGSDSVKSEPAEYTGDVAGAPFRIVVPPKCNGQLIMSAQGWPATGSDPKYKKNIDIPMGNPDLLALGYAWAASGFNPKHFLPHNEHNYVPYEAAHDLLALRDHFFRDFEAPSRTFITGLSMGGNTTLLSLELFPTAYDGAVVWSTSVSQSTVDYEAHSFVLGAFACGISPSDFSGVESVPTLSSEVIAPTLRKDERARRVFLELWTHLSGGPRPHCRTTIDQTYTEATGVATTPLVMRLGAFDNREFRYSGVPTLGVTDDEINAQVIRINSTARRDVDPNFSSLRGSVPVPLLMMHTTGDSSTPVSGLQDFRRQVIAHGDENNLVQRLVQAPGHGDFTGPEIVAAWHDFFAWIEDGTRPKGDDVLASLENAGAEFTDPSRG